jgi:hypothetical protein
VLVLSGSGPSTPPAHGEPLVLQAPLAVLPAQARPGISARMVLGPESARITRGHEIPTAAGPAYLYGDATGRCLSAPDPAADDPATERGVTCVPAATFARFGISLTIQGRDGGGTYVAAIPQGVANPTVRTGGATRELRPTNFGVVAVSTATRAVVTLFDRSGARRDDVVGAPRGRAPLVPARPGALGTSIPMP